MKQNQLNFIYEQNSISFFTRIHPKQRKYFIKFHIDGRFFSSNKILITEKSFENKTTHKMQKEIKWFNL